ncbi:hypothetical protein HYDPIDRAFT_112125 [Hydnomerulius pinastri MD-312]|uniref:BTB domain-containing protein n=1 Tax=Hydnomerulius pinastri MD-312 TaxID=994086 RepID=A0A0C9W958_9AGAM|nr:hypothetical protein HYDPIDRAFT_112125 [Hydnomerulius pinastri MD-312]
MRRSCQGVVVKVETSFGPCKCACGVCRGIHADIFGCTNKCGCGCPSTPSIPKFASTMDTPLTGDNSKAVPLVIDSSKPVSILQKLRLTVKVTILSSSKLDNFSDIRSDVAARSQWVNMDHDQSCIQREQAGVSALERSLKSGVSFDAKFLAYSRRLIPGHVAEPMPVYADMSVLKAKSAHLDFAGPDLHDSLKSLFASDLEGHSAGQSPVLEDYEYESDSDLDDDEVLVHRVELEEPPVGSELDTDEKPRAAAVAEVQAKGDVQAPDDSDNTSITSFSEFDSLASDVPVRTADSTIMKGAGVATPSPTLPIVEHTVIVKGTAYRTWLALVFYCYTGQIVFCPLRSQVAPGAQFSRPLQSVGGPPPCSPKSMYRLADKLGIETLKTLSFVAIEERLSKANILHEAFSKFTSKFPEVQKMEVAILVDNRKTTEILQGLPDKMLAVSFGKMPHAAPVLTAFYQQMTKF